MNFANVFEHESDRKLTENGAEAFSHLNNPTLELFAQIGALRPRTEVEIEQKFADSYAYNRDLTLKMLFMCGNIRGGLGERRTFRVGLRWFARNYPEDLKPNIALIPYFNRYDSLFVLRGTPCEDRMVEFISHTLADDMKAMAAKKPISLLAKWMPSENASSAQTIELARFLRGKLKMDARTYRKVLSALRKHLKVVERYMSGDNWDYIHYQEVPAYAMKNYSQAFARHDPDDFAAYKLALSSGDAKVNASVLYPYDLVHQVRMQTGDESIIEAQWKALPNYVSGDNNIVVMADVSGSMMGRPMETSIGLAIYFAQHNKGAYHGKYMTFTDDPHFLNIQDGWTLSRCVGETQRRGIGYSTNLSKAFINILENAKKYGVSNSEMPKALVIVSDMEIDPYMNPRRDYTSRNYSLDFVDEMKRRFNEAGYDLPKLVLWNVEARNDTFLSKNENVLFVSGQSTSTFKNLCGALNGKTAWDFMVETLNDKMYDCIVL